jgi:nitrogen PTS system EIIA component
MDQLDVGGLARYLRKDAREIDKLAKKGEIPGRKVGGDWRFSQAEINEWLSVHLPKGTHEHLHGFDLGHTHSEDRLVTSLMQVELVVSPLRASSRSSVLRELIKVASESGLVYDSDAILDAVQKREEITSTACQEGVAFPHPRRPQTDLLGDSLIVLGKSGTGIPYGCDQGSMTDIFFMILCKDSQTHLRALARLSRMIRTKDFLKKLRALEEPSEILSFIEQTEHSLGVN